MKLLTGLETREYDALLSPVHHHTLPLLRTTYCIFAPPFFHLWIMCFCPEQEAIYGIGKGCKLERKNTIHVCSECGNDDNDGSVRSPVQTPEGGVDYYGMHCI